ncbi:MAG: cation:proton antiporter [Candidatus Makaraimicrobium thalassicum]|nr:MAG: cation:proton antiporter [Candidatus Omnitrophota bacterium]
MNILLVIGIIILLGTIGGRIFRKLNLPQVMGYIIIGLLLGESFHGFLSGPVLDSFRPITSLALGIIGFMIGSELRFDRFKRYSRSIYTILFVEAFLTFFVVAAVAALITKKIYMGLMLGALASATAPAATYSVLGEYKARGPLTTTTLSIVALDDALALLIYGFASVFARALIVHESLSFGRTMGMPLFQIAVSVLIGIASGFVLHNIGERTREKERMLPFTLGTVILVVGLSIYFKVDPILASMVLGTVASNLQPSEKQGVFDDIKKLSSPIFILFFVLVGARLDARILAKGGVLLLAVAYILSRSFGKMAGAYIGGKISGARSTVTRYLGFCLFDQAGVAVGLSIAVFHTFSSLGGEVRLAGIMIISIITATTFLLQLVAPPLIKYGIKKADEMNRNITEEDVINANRVSDVMDEDFFVIRENDNLHRIIDVMKKSNAYKFPVVGMDGNFMGVISLGEIRDTFYEEQMDMLILAGDIVRESDVVVHAKQELRDAMDIFETKNIDYIPVMKEKGSRKLVGQLEYRKVAHFISKEVLSRQQGLEV